MLEEIGSLDRIPWAVARAKDKKDAFRLMGFGHRVRYGFALSIVFEFYLSRQCDHDTPDKVHTGVQEL